MLLYYLLLTVSSIIHSIGELLYKQGSETVFDIDEEGISRLSYLIELGKGLLSTIIIVSLLLSLVAKVLFGISLSSLPLSIASPLFLSLIVVLSTFFGQLFLSEEISRSKMMGVILICLGIFLVIR